MTTFVQVDPLDGHLLGSRCTQRHLHDSESSVTCSQCHTVDQHVSVHSQTPLKLADVSNFTRPVKVALGSLPITSSKWYASPWPGQGCSSVRAIPRHEQLQPVLFLEPISSFQKAGVVDVALHSLHLPARLLERPEILHGYRLPPRSFVTSTPPKPQRGAAHLPCAAERGHYCLPTVFTLQVQRFPDRCVHNVETRGPRLVGAKKPSELHRYQTTPGFLRFLRSFEQNQPCPAER